MTQTLDTAHAASITELQTRHAKLMTSVRNYTDTSVTASTAELTAARSALMDNIDAKEQSLLGLAQRKATKPLPSMILDFREQVFLQGNRIIERGRDVADLLQVLRGSSKWCFGPTGNVREFPANTVAYAYDPTTGEAKGISLEGAGTNLHPYSTDMTNANVTRLRCDVAVSSETSPITGQKAFKLTCLENNTTGLDPGTFSVTNGTKYTTTVIAKAGSANGITLVFKSFQSGWQAGEIRFDGSVDSSTGSGWKLEEQCDLRDGWVMARVSCTASQDSTAASVEYRITHNDANPAVGQTIHLAHWQIETGNGSTIIPTAATAVTRAADNMLRDLSFEHNPNGFTFYVEGVQTSDTGSLVFYSLNNSTSKSIRVGVPSNNNAIFWVNYDRLANISTTNFPVVKGGSNKIAVSVNATRFAVACNGSVSYTSTPPQGIPIFNRAKLGAISDTNNAINGTIAEFRAYPMAMEAADLIVLTT